MKRVHSLRFETLEGRRMLSTTHPAVAHAAHVSRAAAVSLVLNGSLTVDNNPDAATSTTNVDGSTTTSLPVSGELSGLGRVRGIWNETLDEFGDYEGPDTLILRDAKGAFGVAFNNQNSTPANAKTHGAITFDHAQKVLGGTGAYARASESGSIGVTTNAARTQVVSLTLQTRNT
jgi:hypothetical protein